jgi:hypothetical protein
MSFIYFPGHPHGKKKNRETFSDQPSYGNLPVKLLNGITRCGLFLLLLLLSGCGAVLNPYHENFNCQAPEDSPAIALTLRPAYEEAVGINQPLKKEEAKPEKQIDAARLDRLAQLLKEPQAPMIVPLRILVR